MTMTMDKPQDTAAPTGALIATGWLWPFSGERPGGTVWSGADAGFVPVELRATDPADRRARWFSPNSGTPMRGLLVGPEARRKGDVPVRVVVTGPPHPKTVRCPDCEGHEGVSPCGRCSGEGRITA